MYIVNSCIYGTWHTVDLCFTESELIDVLIDVNNKYHTYTFDIIESLDNIRYPYRRTNSREEFESLLYEYNTTKDIPDLSAVELKRLILERVKL
jgi:hypothetical protein